MRVKLLCSKCHIFFETELKQAQNKLIVCSKCKRLNRSKGGNSVAKL